MAPSISPAFPWPLPGRPPGGPRGRPPDRLPGPLVAPTSPDRTSPRTQGERLLGTAAGFAVGPEASMFEYEGKPLVPSRARAF